MANMRELFPEFYLDSLEMSDLKRRQNNLIIFDSNFLLDILRLPTEIAEKYLEAIDKVKEHIFVPYLVGVEFNFNKKRVKIETLENVKVYKDQISSLLQVETEKIYKNLCESLLKEDNVEFLNNKVHPYLLFIKIYFRKLYKEKYLIVHRTFKQIFTNLK